MTANLQNPIFFDDEKAREALEAVRWPTGPVCPHCGSLSKIGKVEGKSHRPGLYYCGECTGHFTVTVGTVFEKSKISLSKWWLAVHLLSSSKKGMSSNQLSRMLGVTYKTAWFMTHRIREAMNDPIMDMMGGEGAVVEVDETYIGSKAGKTKKRGHGHKRAVLTLVERGGKSRSFHVDGTSAADVMPILQANILKETRIMTDEAGQYRQAGNYFAGHAYTTHTTGEYVRGDVHTNTVEGFYSVFKRGMKGIYQHCGENHLHRYLTEFDFRYTNRSGLGVDDNARANKVMKGAGGKRLTYRRISG